MVVENSHFHTGQGSLYRLNLPNDIYAVSIVRNHFRYAANLPLNAGQPPGCCVFGLCLHHAWISRSGCLFGVERRIFPDDGGE
jgi:hypothetical protein